MNDSFPYGSIHRDRWLSHRYQMSLDRDKLAREALKDRPYTVKAKLVSMHGIGGLSWCKYLEVHTDKPNLGFLKAIPLNSVQSH